MSKVPIRTHALLSRVDSELELFGLLQKVAADYDLGGLIAYDIIQIGYEELNVRVTTTRQTVVVKIFSKDKTYDVVHSYIRGWGEFSHIGIPVPKLLEHRDGPVYEAQGKVNSLYLCVMEYFDGQSFTDLEPTEEDFRALTYYLARINTLSFKVTSSYDSWGTANLVREFEAKIHHLDYHDLHLIRPTVEAFRVVDFSLFRKCIIHGDLQRNNVLKNAIGEYCILDLGCMTFGIAAVDLAIFLALFCFNPERMETSSRISQVVINEYMRQHDLTQVELNAIPLLIEATYAAYLIASSYALSVGDSSQQSQDWLSLSREALRQLRATPLCFHTGQCASGRSGDRDLSAFEEDRHIDGKF